MMRVLTLVALLAVVPLVTADDKPDADQAEQQEAMKKLEALKAAGAKEEATKKASAATATADGLHPRVALETTKGTIVLQLDGDKAPISTKNFIDYAKADFYDGLIFHRVIDNFMIQGGGYTKDMTQRKEGLRAPIANEWQNGLKNTRGTIAMARLGGQPDSATAQFFINVKDNTFLDQPRDGAAYAVFGKVVEGMDVVDKIRNAETGPHESLPRMGNVVPKEPIVIDDVKVVGEYDADKLTKKVAAATEALKAARAAAEAKKEKALDEFVTKLAEEHGKPVEETESGLRYLVLEEGTGESPEPTDLVEVHYTGKLLDGKKFDSSHDRGQPAKFPLNRVIRGWTEGVSMMKVGGKRILVCPPDLAYGKAGRPPVIPPESTLVFEVELLSVQTQTP